MNGEELYEVRRRVAFADGVVLPQWIVLAEADRQLWDNTAYVLLGFGLLRPRLLNGFVPTARRPVHPTPPPMGRPWNKTK